MTTLVPYSVEPRARHQVFRLSRCRPATPRSTPRFRLHRPDRHGGIALRERRGSPADRSAQRLDLRLDGPLLACIGLPPFEAGDELTDRGTRSSASSRPSRSQFALEGRSLGRRSARPHRRALTAWRTRSRSWGRSRRKTVSGWRNLRPREVRRRATPDEITERFMELDVNSRLPGPRHVREDPVAQRPSNFGGRPSTCCEGLPRVAVGEHAQVSLALERRRSQRSPSARSRRSSPSTS